MLSLCNVYWISNYKCYKKIIKYTHIFYDREKYMSPSAYMNHDKVALLQKASD